MTASNQKFALVTALFWFIFAGTASFCAFVLPVHIWAMINGYSLKSNLFTKLYFIIFAFCALFHSFYRMRTICLDLGAHKSRFRDLVLIILFLALTCSSFYIIYF